MSVATSQQITIVTGLPRSGTSMMMKMLEAGGVPPLCDGERTADSDNPNGYYEYEPVKQTKSDPSWLNNAAGRAVKMVYSLLYDVPTLPTKNVTSDRPYDVLFMRRDLHEILASQRQMLSNMQLTTDIDDGRMGQLFAREINRFQAWLKTANHINVLEVDYNAVARGEATPFEQINAHLGGQLNTNSMAAVVDPCLYRNRSAA